MADIDAVLERLVTDPAFRAHVSSNAGEALAAYDLSAEDLQLLASSIDDSAGGQRGVEQRTSKSAVVGLLASLTGGGGGGGGGKGQASDVLAPAGNLSGGSPDEIAGIKSAPAGISGNLAPGSGDSGIGVDSGIDVGPVKGEASPEYFAPPTDEETVHKLPGKPKPGEITLTRAMGGSDDAPFGKDSAGMGSDEAFTYKDGPQGDAAVQGNFAPDDQGLASAADIFAKAPASSDSDVGNLAPGEDSARKLEMPQMKAGDTSVVTERMGVATGNGGGGPDVNGDSDASQLIGLLSPSTDADSPVLMQNPSLKSAAVDVFTVEDA